MIHDWLIKTNHTVQKIDPPAGGYELEQLQEMVGGYIEIVPIPASFVMGSEMCIVANEEGMIKKLPLNDVASIILGSYILGDVLICKSKNIKI